MSDSCVSIALLLPDILGTYSDSGNATVLAQRLRWRGIHARVVTCDAGQSPPTSCDLYVLGGGEDAAQRYAARWLLEHRALRTALAGSAVTLAVCAGLQILGRWMSDAAGNRHPGAELLDLTTGPRRRRATGVLLSDCTLPGVGTLCGFENHQGATTLGPDASPLGRVISGIGNGDLHRILRPTEGALGGQIIATYLHGPVLACNPALADYLLTRALGYPLAPLEVPDQAASRQIYHTRFSPFGQHRGTGRAPSVIDTTRHTP